jgi:hypothetical protein
MVAHTAHGWFLGYDRGEKLSPGWHMGEDLRFGRQALELAGALVLRQQFLPAVLETREIAVHWWPCWVPAYEAEDLKRLELLARAMPLRPEPAAGSAGPTRSTTTAVARSYRGHGGSPGDDVRDQ